MVGTRAVLDGTKRAGVQRLLVVGGAGSLFVAPGVLLMDTPEFKSMVPPEILPGVRGAREALDLLRPETVLEWTFVSPSAKLAPGERTGKFRIGGDELLMNGAEPAGISVADLAVAIVDEIERPAHIRQRFTVGY
jgi:putative NADH-flavin reductase